MYKDLNTLKVLYNDGARVSNFIYTIDILNNKTYKLDQLIRYIGLQLFADTLMTYYSN